MFFMYINLEIGVTKYYNAGGTTIQLTKKWKVGNILTLLSNQHKLVLNKMHIIQLNDRIFFIISTIIYLRDCVKYRNTIQ